LTGGIERSAAVIEGMTPKQISEMQGGANNLVNKKWDRMFGSVILPNLTDAGDSITGENLADTLFVYYKFRTKWTTITVEIDTVTLPGTTYFAWSEDIWTEALVATLGDTGVSVVPYIDGDYGALSMDQFFFDYIVADTSGASGDLTGTLSWWFKFVEDN
jgi:hypothetical protein